MVLVDQHCALPEQAVVALDDQVDGPVEQGMAWRHVLGQRPALGGDKTLLEGHTLVPAHQGSAHADLAVTETQFGGDVTDLEPARLTFPNGSADVRESRQEEGADEVRLELPGLGTLHFLPDPLDVAGRHDVADQCTVVDHPAQRLAHGGIYDNLEILLYLGLLAVPDRSDQQVAQALSAEGLAEDVENLITERLTLFLQLLEEPLEHLALTGVLGNQVP